MATLDTNSTRSPGFKAFSDLSLGLAALTDRFSAYRKRRATHIALGKLSDRELDDIGLTRGDIPTRL